MSYGAFFNIGRSNASQLQSYGPGYSDVRGDLSPGAPGYNDRLKNLQRNTPRGYSGTAGQYPGMIPGIDPSYWSHIQKRLQGLIQAGSKYNPEDYEGSPIKKGGMVQLPHPGYGNVLKGQWHDRMISYG